MKSIFSCLLLFSSLTVHAALYKGIDENGNVSYSDTPFAHAKKINPESLSIIETGNPGTTKQEPDAKKPMSPQTPSSTASYKKLTILSPKNQQTIWNNNNLTINVAVSPALLTKSDDYFQLLMDGKTVIKKSTQLKFQLGFVERGTHKLQLMLRNSKNRLIKRSNPVIIYIKHSIVPKSSPAKKL